MRIWKEDENGRGLEMIYKRQSKEMFRAQYGNRCGTALLLCGEHGDRVKGVCTGKGQDVREIKGQWGTPLESGAIHWPYERLATLQVFLDA